LKLTQLILGISAGLVVAYSQAAPLTLNETDLNETGSVISTQISQEKLMPNYVQLEGRLEAINQSTISAQTSGIVETVTVDVNDQVAAGDTLVLINSSQQQAQLSQAQANLAQTRALNEDAQILLKRNRSLLRKKTLSQGTFDSSVANAKSTQASVLAAQAQVKQAQEQLSYTHVKAPYAGTVSQRMVQVGELVTPGQPLMEGFSPQYLRAITDIHQKLVSQLNISVRNPIMIQALGESIQAEQFTLFPYADSRYSSIRARIDLPSRDDHSLLPGTWVEILLPIAAKKGIYVPSSAILLQGEVATLYVKNASSGHFKLRYVRLGQVINEKLNKGFNERPSQKQGQQVEVISGLSPDEEIATDALPLHNRSKQDRRYEPVK
jgi:RND family efflux transporter MFP subunit